MKLAIVGLGKLGLPMAALYANAGHEVWGIDTNERLIDALNRGECPYPEDGLAELLENQPRLVFTMDFGVVAHCDLTSVIVPTPSVDGVFSNEFVLTAVTRIGAALRELKLARRNEHTVVICSTVMPGVTEGVIYDALVEAADSEDIGLAYSPEFIALGSVVNDLQHPDFLLIGATTRETADLVEQTLRSVARDGGPVQMMTPTEAEITKLAVNTYITMKISYANQIGELCASVGADSEVVLEAIGTDHRVGRSYLKAGMPYGGPCFPRDTIAFRHFCQDQRVPPFLGKAVDLVNERRKDYLANFAQDLPGPYAIFGVAYKPGTNVLDESASFVLAQLLADAGHDVLIVDPIASGAVQRVLGDNKVTCVNSLEEALEPARAVKTVIIGNESEAVRERISARAYERGLHVLDIWSA